LAGSDRRAASRDPTPPGCLPVTEDELGWIGPRLPLPHRRGGSLERKDGGRLVDAVYVRALPERLAGAGDRLEDVLSG